MKISDMTEEQKFAGCFEILRREGKNDTPKLKTLRESLFNLNKRNLEQTMDGVDNSATLEDINDVRRQIIETAAPSLPPVPLTAANCFRLSMLMFYYTNEVVAEVDDDRRKSGKRFEISCVFDLAGRGIYHE